MANNQDKAGDHGADTNVGNAGQQGGHGSAGDMTDRQKGGQRPEDKTDKDWAQSQDTGRQGGQSLEQPEDKENLSDTGTVGGQQRDPGQRMDKER
ncbi:hypothetical protein [Pseudomonas mosselii]|uniref:Uncharacterized protein n=1 Tax=Pseudomonas mosselii TaxID=78327 RepID=A0A7W2JYA3_9PSED|nr:hypothetical protein [Pseudomonas mosselii]KXG80953.1 hypothetical protein AXZ07_20430 [Pseudomonas mosselii]MBA6067419.1 hypothetical protein [Pseudomonas mosselii]